MNDLIIKQTHALIQAGEIAEAESALAVIAEQEGDHALVEVLDEMAPKDVLAVMPQNQRRTPLFPRDAVKVTTPQA